MATAFLDFNTGHIQPKTLALDTSDSVDAESFAAMLRDWDDVKFEFVGRTSNNNNKSVSGADGSYVDLCDDLSLQKDTFSKLKSRFLDLRTKQSFMQSLQQDRDSWGNDAEAVSDRLKAHKKEHTRLEEDNTRMENEIRTIAAELAALYTKMVANREAVREQAVLVLPDEAGADKQKRAADKVAIARAESALSAEKEKNRWYKEFISTLEHLGGTRIVDATPQSVTVMREKVATTISFARDGSVTQFEVEVRSSDPQIPYDDIAEYAIEINNVAFFLREYSARKRGWAARQRAVDKLVSSWSNVQIKGSNAIVAHETGTWTVAIPFDFPSRTGSRVAIVQHPATVDRTEVEKLNNDPPASAENLLSRAFKLVAQ